MFNPLMGRAVIAVRPMLPDQPTVTEIGSQTLGFKVGELPDVKTVPEFYRSIGFADYASIDFNGEGSTNLDLNHVINGEQADLVTNNGTGEHVFNQAAVFESAHNLCRPGGYMLHLLPWVNWINHGFYNFHPVLFNDLARANGYEIVHLYGADREGNIIFENTGFDEIKKPDAIDKNVILVVSMKKHKDEPFKYPIQTKYDIVEEKENILQASWLEYSNDPFPHAIGKVNDDYFGRLESMFPLPDDIVLGRKEKNNILLQRNAAQVLGDESTPTFWRWFFEEHTSRRFLQEVIKLFGAEILDKYPHLSKNELETGVRFRDSAPFLLDCQFAVNTPVKRKCSVRGPHIDDPKELYAGMVYMGGGELNLYKWKGKRKFTGRGGMKKRAECDPKSVVKVSSIQCDPGTVFLFLNTPDSIHGVSPRSKGEGYRSYLNIIGEAEQPLFDLK